MKTLGQARQVVFFTAALEHQLPDQFSRQCRLCGRKVFRQQQPRDLVRHAQQVLGEADIHQQ